MASRANGNAPLTTDQLIGMLLKDKCPGCTFTQGGMVNALQCQVIKNLRTQVIDPATVLGNPCQTTLVCGPASCSAGTAESCQAEGALETLTDPNKAAGMYTKATAGAVLCNIPANCPLGFSGIH